MPACCYDLLLFIRLIVSQNQAVWASSVSSFLMGGGGGRSVIDWLIDWLGFNGNFSTVRLYRALKNYSLVKRLISVRQLKIPVLRFGECNNMCESWELGKYCFRLCSYLVQEHKMCLIDYKILNTTQPSYLYDLYSASSQSQHTFFTLCHYHQTIIITQSHSSILPTCFTSSLEPASYITQNSSFELFISFSATFIWTCQFNLLHTAITFHHFFTVSL